MLSDIQCITLFCKLLQLMRYGIQVAICHVQADLHLLQNVSNAVQAKSA